MRKTYDDTDKARVYVLLTANNGNIKRTAREGQVPESTVRRWQAEWDKNGPPPLEEVDEAVKDFVSTAMVARDLAVEVIVMKLELLKQNPDKAKLVELSTVAGVMDDKISRAKGLDTGGKVDHYHHLPPADEIREMMQGFVSGAISAAERRAEEIVDAEFTEQPALPAGK